MSEQERSRLYAWLCDQTDARLAEYLMSCLAPAPLSDLVTKEFLRSELSRFATKDDLAEFAQGIAAQREADQAAATAQREADQAAATAQREADRLEAKQQFRWLIGTIVGSLGIMMTMFGVLTAIILGSAGGA